MDSRAPVSSLSLFRETQTDLEPANSGSVIQIQVPSASTFSVKPRQQRRILRSAPTCKDEDSYNKNNLAISSSFYFGRAKRHPRSFLWRVLQEGRVLELRSVDLKKKNGETREASYIIQLHFASTIKPNGVALTDTEDQDSLSIFAITKANDLYTLAIRKDFFCHAAASEEDVSRWCKVARPATFSISTPHSLIAGNSQLLIISLSDGRLLQLTRNKEDDGSKWHESTYGDGQWTSSLRGLVRWQGSNTVKYDGTTLEQGTATAMAISPDKSHLFAVCLNHTLRIWNPTKAASVFSKDLLWQHREPHETPKLMLDPGSPNVLQVFETYRPMEGDLYYAVTFSPHDLGQFKFWGIRDPDHGDRGVRDLFSDWSFKPPDPDPSPESKVIWKVADFKIKGAQRGQQLEIWVLMRSNKRHKLYNLKFDLEDLRDSWQNSWTNTATETFSDQPAPQLSDLDPEDAADKWLEYIMCPGKYPETILETALAIYCSERAISLPNPKASLTERMCSAISLQVDTRTGENDFSKHHKASDQEWTVLWQDIRDLDKSRWQVSSLAYDGYAEIPHIAFTNGAAAIRTCDKVEIISLNTSAVLAKSIGMLEAPSIEMERGIEPKLPDELAVIVSAAAIFRQYCSYGLLQKCSAVLAEELWLDPSLSVPLRIESFYDRCNFTEEVGKDHFERLEDSLEPIGGFNKLETQTFLSILDELSHRLPPESSGLSHTNFGQRMLVNGARDMIASREKLLFDLLIMVVFVDMDIHRDEIPMKKFHGPRIYVELLDLLRQYQIMQWLATNIRAEKTSDNPPPATIKTADMGTSSNEQNKISTVLENLFALHLPPQSHDMQSQCEAFTHTIQDLLQWVLGGNEQIGLDEVRVYIQCNLLANNNLNLATGFLRYQPSTDWSTYIKGRLCLLKGDFNSAAIYFKKAAFKLCTFPLNPIFSKTNLLRPQPAPQPSTTPAPPTLSYPPWTPSLSPTASQPITPTSSTSSTPPPPQPKWPTSPTSPSNSLPPPPNLPNNPSPSSPLSSKPPSKSQTSPPPFPP